MFPLRTWPVRGQGRSGCPLATVEASSQPLLSVWTQPQLLLPCGTPLAATPPHTGCLPSLALQLGQQALCRGGFLMPPLCLPPSLRGMSVGQWQGVQGTQCWKEPAWCLCCRGGWRQRGKRGMLFSVSWCYMKPGREVTPGRGEILSGVAGLSSGTFRHRAPCTSSWVRADDEMGPPQAGRAVSSSPALDGPVPESGGWTGSPRGCGLQGSKPLVFLSPPQNRP